MVIHNFVLQSPSLKKIFNYVPKTIDFYLSLDTLTSKRFIVPNWRRFSHKYHVNGNHETTCFFGEWIVANSLNNLGVQPRRTKGHWHDSSRTLYQKLTLICCSISLMLGQHLLLELSWGRENVVLPSLFINASDFTRMENKMLKLLQTFWQSWNLNTLNSKLKWNA